MLKDETNPSFGDMFQFYWTTLSCGRLSEGPKEQRAEIRSTKRVGPVGVGVGCRRCGNCPGSGGGTAADRVAIIFATPRTDGSARGEGRRAAAAAGPDQLVSSCVYFRPRPTDDGEAETADGRERSNDVLFVFCRIG